MDAWDQTHPPSGTVTGTCAGGIPGDCNGDQKVSIGEVQEAITAFLGMAASPYCAACQGL